MTSNQELITPALENLVDRLSVFDEVKSVILFGSRACGDAGERSDIDLAISAPQLKLRRWLDMKLLAEEAPTLLSITLVRLEDSPPELRERVLKEGIVLYEQKKDRRQSGQPRKGDGKAKKKLSKFPRRAPSPLKGQFNGSSS